MVNKPKNKGRRKEHLVKKWFEHNGFNAFRTPLSGALRDFPGDVQVRLNNEVRLKVEVKARKNPPKVFTGWIGGNDLLVLIPDHHSVQESYAFMPMRTLQELIGKWNEESDDV
jgi:hypothetical protein|tara:strand:- start:764 stop:1102 length:339 start_codon:yes stop_codon:yes gene_type:complete